jgi:hypothetical protein
MTDDSQTHYWRHVVNATKNCTTLASRNCEPYAPCYFFGQFLVCGLFLRVQKYFSQMTTIWRQIGSTRRSKRATSNSDALCYIRRPRWAFHRLVGRNRPHSQNLGFQKLSRELLQCIFQYLVPENNLVAILSSR